MISVSKILQELHSESIVFWANKIGLEWIRLSEYRKKSTSKWIEWHSTIQDRIKKEGYKDYNLIWIEVVLEDEYICGRADIILEKDGVHYIFDFKSSSDIYLSQVLQLLAYKKLYWPCKIWIINIETEKETIIDLEDEETYENILKWLYVVATNRLKSKFN